MKLLWNNDGKVLEYEIQPINLLLVFFMSLCTMYNVHAQIIMIIMKESYSSSNYFGLFTTMHSIFSLKSIGYKSHSYNNSKWGIMYRFIVPNNFWFQVESPHSIALWIQKIMFLYRCGISAKLICNRKFNHFMNIETISSIFRSL